MSSPKSQRFVVSVEVNTNNNLLKSQNDEEDAWRARATEKCVGTIKWKLFLVQSSISTCLSFFLSFFLSLLVGLRAWNKMMRIFRTSRAAIFVRVFQTLEVTFKAVLKQVISSQGHPFSCAYFKHSR